MKLHKSRKLILNSANTCMPIYFVFAKYILEFVIDCSIQQLFLCTLLDVFTIRQ